MIRVLLVDDEELVRAGLRVILDSAADLTVVDEAGDGADAVVAARRCKPDVVVMDVQMPHVDGIEATRAIVDQSSPPKVLVLTMFDLDDHVYAAIEAGASGFLLKDTHYEELLRAVRVVAAGDAMLSPSVTKRVMARFGGSPGKAKAAQERLDTLTPRENSILELVGAGMSNSAIARTLQLTESTVKGYVSQLFMKLDCENRVQVAILAHDAGVVS
ncbi:response regulator [Allosaccharopolyspora coralli]|uniref:Response regulator n=1 Tax=Allosaccharopolyspora coralli TaxID=2665642 RepID=A0A5Q3Q4S4_9PSEU|nr:response regulator transcription factor [Allosaccharopolyspora coralli]QGK68496.1 response regulator [Allosaccharopolyspora coralli]